MNTKETFAELIQSNQGLIYKIARVYAADPEDEKDLRQEIIFQLWKSFDSYRNDAKITSWMYRIALNTSIAYLSKRKSRGKIFSSENEVPDGADPVDTNKAEKKMTCMLRSHNLIHWIKALSYSILTGTITTKSQPLPDLQIQTWPPGSTESGKS